MSAPQGVLDQVEGLVEERAKHLQGYWTDELRPEAERLLREYAVVSMREAAGEDVETAKIALESSALNLSRVQQSVLQLEARDLALKAAMAVLAASL